MKSVSTLHLRNNLGNILDAVQSSKEPVLVLKNNQPVAQITPLPEVQRTIDLEKVYRTLKNLPPAYQISHDIDEDLLSVIGAGTYVALEDEAALIEENLREKYG